MIVSHRWKFVIAAPAGMGAAAWLKRIHDEGEPECLELVGHANSVCVPEGCEGYDRFFVDNPRNRLPFMWISREGTLWEGPEGEELNLEEWMRWYVWGMRRKFLALGVAASPNGWGMREEDGEWMFFESPATLARTFAGIGNSPLGEEAPWGRREIRIVYMEDTSRGWKDILKLVTGTSVVAKQTRDLLNWHQPMSQLFYELPDELASVYLRDTAWTFKHQKGIEK